MWIFEEESGGCVGVCLGVRGLDGFVGSGEPVTVRSWFGRITSLEGGFVGERLIGRL